MEKVFGVRFFGILFFRIIFFLGLASCTGILNDSSKVKDDPSYPSHAPSSCDKTDDGDVIFYITEDGNDDGEGSQSSPWASIGHGITQIPDGATLLVGPGTYRGRIRLDSQFEKGVVIRAEPSYQARLRNDETVVTVFEGQGITLSGFDIAHDGDGAGALVIHIQDLIGESGGEDAVSRITLRNNILHDSYNNDILKLNNGAKDLLVERNIFYNQEGNDEHIDINSVRNVVIQDNIFFNDFESSGRSNGSDTSSYIVIKDSNEDDDGQEGSENITVSRNIFLNWQGGVGANFLLVGEDGKSYHEAFSLLFENNLFLGNGKDVMRAPLGIKGGRDLVFRHNTVVGELPSDAFAFRFNVEGDNPANDNISLYNNIWSAPNGSMEDFSDTPDGETDSFDLDNNLYWNGGQSIPKSGSDMINWDDDSSAVEGDPLVIESPVVLPVWNRDQKQFSDGSGDICLAFETLVKRHALLGEQSAAQGAARSDKSPKLDILGNPRGAATSIGAYEPQ